MTATLKVQTWSNTTYTWDSANPGTPAVEVETVLDNWISLINLNPSQSGKPVTKLKGAANSTTANYRGFVVKLPGQTTATDLVVRFISVSSITLSMAGMQGSVYGNGDTTYGGYGPNTTVQNEAVDWKNTATTSADFLIAYDVTDGKEFFAISWNIDNTSATMDSFLIAKDHNGQWLFIGFDGTTATGVAVDTQTSTLLAVGSVSAEAPSTNFLGILQLSSTTTTGLTNMQVVDRIWYIDNPNILFLNTSTSFAQYANIGLDSWIRMNYYGPFIKFTPGAP